MEYSIEEFHNSLKRAFKDVIDYTNENYIIMDGQTARDSTFLRECWNYAIDRKIINVLEVQLEQETFMKGYLTNLGKKILFD